jgi:glycerol-3-phosphate acyltransferase PlsY
VTATEALVSALLVAAAYLIGAVPFGYLTARLAKGIDIRTVGSGNIGATNVGRVLGFRFFLLVFACDMAKGLLPTWGFPRLFTTLTGHASPPDLAVLVALATVLGHNFPVYLRFKGGKGVATSLGAILALDPIAGVASALGFVVFLLLTRYVSMSSILGALVFAFVHFVQVAHPWSREERAMTCLTAAMIALMVARHRKNFARIAAGTEPKVSLRRKRSSDRAGRVRAGGVVALAALALALVGGVWAFRHATRPGSLTIGNAQLTEVARAATGHQRAERVAFADQGRLLAVTCPRYDRLVLYRVTDDSGLETAHDVELEGKPVAVCSAGETLLVLQRPPGDERHVRPGWWDAFDLQGQRVGDRVVVGFYPDDMAVSPDGRLAFVVTSGRAEGSPNRGAPALEVFDLNGKSLGDRVTFDGPHDDPARITLSRSGRTAVVALEGSQSAAAIDLTVPYRPRLIGQSSFREVERPYASHGEADVIVMPAGSGREGLLAAIGGLGECLVSTLPHGSGLEVQPTSARVPIGKLALRAGALGLGSTRPIGLAYAPERGLIAVANRSGGVHLVAIRPTVSGPIAAR